MLVVLFLLGSGCTTVRCYETDTVSDELQEENDEQSQQS